MIDFPLNGLLDKQACLQWLEQQSAPDGQHCPRCGGIERRTALTGTIFQKTRQPPSTIMLMLRGIAKGEPTARLARELGVSRKQMHTLRHRVQDNLYGALPTHVLEETVLDSSGTSRTSEFEADELYQNAGEKRSAPHRLARPTPAPHQQAPGAWYV
jgi:hypothetical protein